MKKESYVWTDNPTLSGSSICDADILNDCLMYLKYESKFSRNIGEIVTSTIPLSDASLHLADGSIILSGGSYDDFIQYMKTVYHRNPEMFFTQEEYNRSIITYGVCGKYVYDSVADNIRLPTLMGHLEGTLDNNAGEIIEAGLPNITGSILPKEGITVNSQTWGESITSADGAFSLSTFDDIKAVPDSNANNTTLRNLIFDASKSNPIYKNNIDSVQTQSTLVYFYVVVGSVIKTDVEVNINNVMTDIRAKADIDLNNISSNIDFVVETYRNGDGWYRKYKSGWVEQGGVIDFGKIGAAYKKVNLLVPYSSLIYSVSLTTMISDYALEYGVSESYDKNYCRDIGGFYIYMSGSKATESKVTWTAVGQA